MNAACIPSFYLSPSVGPPFPPPITLLTPFALLSTPPHVPLPTPPHLVHGPVLVLWRGELCDENLLALLNELASLLRDLRGRTTQIDQSGGRSVHQKASQLASE